MVLIKARKAYACLSIFTCLLISLIANSARAFNDEQISVKYLASANLHTPVSISTFEYIVITETPTPSPTQKPTPIPTKTPLPKFSTPANLDEIMTRHANNHSIDRELLKRIAHCESRFNTHAVNGIYGGLYQFSSSSWASARRAMNANPDPELRFDAEEAVKTAAFKISLGHKGIWPNCSK